jgi:hypothetical protein
MTKGTPCRALPLLLCTMELAHALFVYGFVASAASAFLGLFVGH